MEEKVRKQWKYSFWRLYVFQFACLIFFPLLSAFILKSAKPLFSVILPCIFSYAWAALLFVFGYEKKGRVLLLIHCIFLVCGLFVLLLLGNAHGSWVYVVSLLNFCLVFDFLIKSIKLWNYNRWWKKNSKAL